MSPTRLRGHQQVPVNSIKRLKLCFDSSQSRGKVLVQVQLSVFKSMKSLLKRFTVSNIQWQRRRRQSLHIPGLLPSDQLWKKFIIKYKCKVRTCERGSLSARRLSAAYIPRKPMAPPVTQPLYTAFFQSDLPLCCKLQTDSVLVTCFTLFRKRLREMLRTPQRLYLCKWQMKLHSRLC